MQTVESLNKLTVDDEDQRVVVQERGQEVVGIMRVGGKILLVEQGPDLLNRRRPGLCLRNSHREQADNKKCTGVPLHSASSIGPSFSEARSVGTSQPPGKLEGRRFR